MNEDEKCHNVGFLREAKVSEEAVIVDHNFNTSCENTDVKHVHWYCLEFVLQMPVSELITKDAEYFVFMSLVLLEQALRDFNVR